MMIQKSNPIKSVHLLDFPKMKGFEADMDLINRIDKVKALCSAALFIRDKHNLRVRLPLNKLTIISEEVDDIKEFESIILEELNVKELEYNTDFDVKTTKKLNLNLQKLGVVFGTKMPQIIKASKTNDWSISSEQKLQIAGVLIDPDLYTIELEPLDKNYSMVVTGYNLVVELDTQLNDSLINEGIARDVVRLVQQSRKDANLDVSDRIDLTLICEDEALKKAIISNAGYIQEQTLAETLSSETRESKFLFDSKVGDSNIKIGISVI